jgi:hypothetical protein
MTDFTKTMQMGIGEAIQRLLKVELLLQRGIALVPEETRAERQLIIDALNTHKLDLGFDCNLDGMPDTVEIFAKSAATSCCKIVNSDTSRTTRPASSRRRTQAQKEDAATARAKAEAEALMRAAAEAAAQAEAEARAEAEALEEAMRAAEAAEAAAAAETQPKKPARGGSRRKK